LESNELTKANAEELEIGFKDMVMGVQSLSELGKELDRLKDFNYNLIVDINSEYATYVIELINQNNEIILNDAQVSNFAKMGELMHGYQKIIEKTLDVSGEVSDKGVLPEYWEVYRKKGVDDDYWIDLLEGYSDVTNISFYLD
jgi:hypothetical protein